MKKLLFLFFALILIFGCSKNNDYKYIETSASIDPYSDVMDNKDKPIEIISAESDSDAYIDAYRRFCYSTSTSKITEMKRIQIGMPVEMPISFKLIDKHGNDIAGSIWFQTKKKQESEMMKRIVTDEKRIMK